MNVEPAILIVDDESDILDWYSMELNSQKLPYRVLRASNGEEALVEFEKSNNEIAVMITDYPMPKLNGIGLIEKLSSKVTNLDLTIMCTGNSAAPEVKKLAESKKRRREIFINPKTNGSFYG